MAKTIVHEGVGFNQDWLLSFKTEKEFLDAMNKVEEDGSGYKHIFENDAHRTEKLKELYKVAQPAKEESKTAVGVTAQPAAQK